MLRDNSAFVPLLFFLPIQVLHPKNPFAPTLHFNYRYFETDAPKGIFRPCFKIKKYYMLFLRLVFDIMTLVISSNFVWSITLL